MDATVLPTLRDYLNERTLPGRPYQVGPGISWSAILPRQSYAEDIKATLSDARVRTMVGIIMPGGSRVVETARQGYSEHQPRGGAIREAQIYLTVFARSLKAYAYEGELLEIEDLLQELVGDFSTKDHPKVLSAGLGEMTPMTVPPDFTVFEFAGALRYKTVSLAEHAARLRQIALGGPGAGSGPGYDRPLLDFTVDLQDETP